MVTWTQRLSAQDLSVSLRLAMVGLPRRLLGFVRGSFLLLLFSVRQSQSHLVDSFVRMLARVIVVLVFRSGAVYIHRVLVFAIA